MQHRLFLLAVSYFCKQRQVTSGPATDFHSKYVHDLVSYIDIILVYKYLGDILAMTVGALILLFIPNY